MLFCIFVRCAVIASLGQSVGFLIELLILISGAKENVSGFAHNNTTLPKDTTHLSPNEPGIRNGRRLNESCKNSSQCVELDRYSYCVGLNETHWMKGTCQCKESYTKVGQKYCRPGKRLNEECNTTSQCQEMDRNSYCVRTNKTRSEWKKGTCQCNEAYTSVGIYCIYGRPLGSRCENNADCQKVENNSYCLKDPSSWMHLTCRCKKRYLRAGLECIPVGTYVGDECDTADQCQQSDINTDCYYDGSPYRTCRCKTDYRFDQFYRKCFRGIALGQNCFHHVECQLSDSNSFCERMGSTSTRICQCNGPIKAGKCVYVAAVMRSDQTEFSRALYIILITLGIGVPLCCAVTGITCLRKRKRHQGQLDSNLSAVPSSQASSNTYPSLPVLAGTSGCEQTSEPCKPQSEEKLQFLDNPPAYEDVVHRASFMQNQQEISPPSYLQAVQCFQNLDISSSQCLSCNSSGES